jgi:steroid delta-isomerase-like uncharacterized protein
MAEVTDLVQTWIRAHNDHDIDRVRALLAPDFHQERNGVGFEGSDIVAAGLKAEWGNWPDARFEVKEITAAGNRAVFEMTWTVTHTQPVTLPNGTTIRPTGKTAVNPAVHVWEAKDGLLVSQRIYLDRMGMFAQLGVTVTVG